MSPHRSCSCKLPYEFQKARESSRSFLHLIHGPTAYCYKERWTDQIFLIIVYYMKKIDPLISVQISAYAPDGDVREAVHCYLDSLDAAGLDRDTCAMSSVVWGEAAAIWPALQSAYKSVAVKCKVIVHTVMCNAAPLPAGASGRR